MPSTVNGIGTRYVGRRDLETYQAVCEFCKQPGTLSNYSTGLWICFAYLPVIPLGRKQIFCDCSRCRRHRVIPLARWEQIKSETIAADEAARAAAPGDPAPAIKLLGDLLAFRRHDEVSALAEQLSHEFAGTAAVHLAVGNALQILQRWDESQRAYLAAMNLEPDNLAAKHGVVTGLVCRGEPAMAARLLSASPQITAAHDPQLFYDLGNSFQKQARHADALAAYASALEAAPQLGRDSTFRKRMQAAEKEAGSGGTLLPHIHWYQKRYAIPGLIAAALLAGFLLMNQYRAENRTLYVINGFSVPVTVRIDGGDAVEVAPAIPMRWTIAEGPHDAALSVGNRSLPSTHFEMKSSLLGRFADQQAFVLNAGGGAVVLWEQAQYAAQPAAGGNGGKQKIYAGQPYLEFDGIQYPFAPFPTHDQDPGSRNRHQDALGIAAAGRVANLGGAENIVSRGDRLVFAENHLAVDPANAPLRRQYESDCEMHGEQRRAQDFLARLSDAK